MCADRSTGNTPNIPQFTKDGFMGNDSLISWMLSPLGCLGVKQQQYQEKIALSNKSKAFKMSEQLLKFG